MKKNIVCQFRTISQSDATCRVLGKMLLTKKAHEKSFTSIEQSLMAGLNC
jgi:hypothetical protein